MEQVGYEMYLKMLNEAIAEEKGEKPPTPPACSVDVQMDANIPEDYIVSMTNRLEIYRRIALIRNDEDKTEMIDELIDRFGEPPQSVINLINTAMLRNVAAKLNITAIKQRNGALYFYFSKITPAQAGALIQAYSSRLSFNDQAKPYYVMIRLGRGDTADTLLPEVIDRMRNAE